MEIKKANKVYQKKVFLYSILTLIGFLILYFFSQDYLNSIMKNADEDLEGTILKLLKMIRILSIMISVVSVLFSIYFAKLAFYILRSKQFPSPEMEVFRDTPIRKGKDAQMRGYIVLIISLIMVFVAIFSPIMINLIVKNIITG